MYPDPTDLELDDDMIELPPLPPVGSDEEVGVGDVGIDLDVGDDEEIGLDDAEGIDDFDPTSLLDFAEEEENLLDDEKGGDDIVQLDAQIEVAGSEYGWTTDNEADASLWEEDDPLVDDLEAWTPEDGGETGTEDDNLLTFEGDDAVVGLPPLRLDEDDDAEETADDLDLEDDGVIALPSLSFEDEVRLMGSELPPPLTTEVEIVARGAVYDVALDDGALWLAGDDLRRLSGGTLETLAARGLEPEDLLSVAVMPGSDGQTLAVGTRLGGVFRSLDGGTTFAPINGWRSGGEPSVGCHVAFDRAGRLWMWAGGSLHRSRDLGNRWAGPVLPAPVLDATIDDGRIVALVASGDHLEVLRCRDDGLAFEPVAPPCPWGEATPRVAVSGDDVAIAHEGDVQGPWVWKGGSWQRVRALGGVHLPAFVEGVLHAALHIAGRDRGVVVRADATVADLVALFGQTPARLREIGADQRIHALRVGEDRVWVASGMGLVSYPR